MSDYDYETEEKKEACKKELKELLKHNSITLKTVHVNEFGHYAYTHYYINYKGFNIGFEDLL